MRSPTLRLEARSARIATWAWDSASSYVLPQAAQLSRSGTQATKQPSSSLQKMSISYLLPRSRTTRPPFPAPPGGSLSCANIVHAEAAQRIPQTGDSGAKTSSTEARAPKARTPPHGGDLHRRAPEGSAGVSSRPASPRPTQVATTALPLKTHLVSEGTISVRLIV